MSTDGMLHEVDPRTTAGDVAWLIRDFVRATPGVRHTVAVSADGLVLAAAGSGLSGEAAERLAAVACGLVSLTRGAAEVCGTGWVNQTVVDMDGGFLCTMTISDGSALTVLTGAGCDIGLVAYEAARLVDRVGAVLTPEVRAGLRRMLMD